MGEKQILCDLAWKYVNPVPLFSGTFDSCMEKGRDISDSGAVYNTTGCVCSYFADAIDSLEAVRYLVYEQKLCTLAELRQILADNWQGHEKLRAQVMKKVPKWGNNDPELDSLAVEVATFMSKLLFNLPNGRGGHFFPSIYGQMVVERGQAIGALPSGRLAGTPMSKNNEISPIKSLQLHCEEGGSLEYGEYIYSAGTLSCRELPVSHYPDATDSDSDQEHLQQVFERYGTTREIPFS